MKNIFLLISLISAIQLTSCLNQKLETDREVVRLSPVDSLEIQIDPTTPTFPRYIDFNTDSNLLLVGNEFNSSIQFYDIQKKQLVKVIEFDEEGPNGIGNMGAITYINNDSILIFDRPTYIKISDNSGKVIFSGLPETNYNLLSSSATRSYIHYGHVFSYNRGAFALNPNNFKGEDSNSIAISFNLLDSTTNDWLTYPESIINNQWDSQQFWYYSTQNKEDNLLTYACAGCDSINTFYDENLSYNTISFGSNLLPKPAPYKYGRPSQLSSVEAAEMKSWFLTKG